MDVLHTERLLLRTVTPDDAPFYLTLLNDPSWIRNIGDRGLHTVEDARTAILKGPVDMQERLGFSLYLVERKQGRTPIGMCGLIKRDFLSDVDIGYAYLPPYWGQGYALEAAEAVLAHARRDIGLARLAAITTPENGSSIRLLRKLGFNYEGQVQLPTRNTPSNLYGFDFRPGETL